MKTRTVIVHRFGWSHIVGTAALFTLFSAFLPSHVIAQNDPLDAPYEEVEFSEGDTLRGVVETHLRDPDLWPSVLKINDISSPADVVPGLVLRMPVQQVAIADASLAASLQAIQRATAEGARLFAPQQIGAAIETRESAVEQREEGAWRAVVDFAGLAVQHANDAYDIALAQRDRAAEAVVSDIKGQVEGRNPTESRWSDRALDDILVEFERLRTLSGSTTQVTFRDLSRLRLNPNSNATIQRMRSDPLTGNEVTKVSLTNGDFYALLNQLSDRSEFEVEVPGIDTRTKSADFWIKNDASGARFVNYDSREDFSISRDGEMIALGRNEGAVLSTEGTQRAGVLSRPQQVAPVDGGVVYGNAAPLEWAPFEAAVAYWFEVATDPGFNTMIATEWEVRETRFAVGGLTPGRYHWRVAALDKLGLPGEWSAVRKFEVRIDDTPPFLMLMSPADGTISETGSIEVMGATEQDAVLRFNGQDVSLNSDGSFALEAALTRGENTLSFRAVDPAGNDSAAALAVIYRPAAEVEIALSDALAREGDVIVTRSAELSVTGTASAGPGAPVVVRDEAGAEILRAKVGASGQIAFTVPVSETAQSFAIEVLSPGGGVEGSAGLTARRDWQPPELALDLPPPLATADPVLILEGDAGDAAALRLGDKAVPLDAGGRFRLEVPLEPGANAAELEARDVAGNAASLRVETLYDIDPPEILRAEATRPDGEGGPIEIVVEARDASGLRQAGRYALAIGGREVDGYLRCDSASGLCRDSLPAEAGDLRLIEVILEDYAGNEAFE
ncbi:FecR protein [Salinihabitans flavidus]|uniref:FecR protein n=1 Tax=Salinihabitans flavidus TaxID=569882 RepID=A0A1H8LEJ1_9RHOB|nr:FecR domain-containing protein [Salinihabitans flavidus]SEO03517.1 FecR protein [Salinihabitans flavidus]